MPDDEGHAPVSGIARVSRKQLKNVSDSIRQRLLNLARERGENFDMVLRNYGRARLLRRLEKSKHANGFVLKGATLFSVWTDKPYRPTKDLDVLGRGDNSVAAVEQAFRELCEVSVEDDGLEFDPASVRGEQVREEDEYEGVRVTLTGTLGKARIPVQIDVGFGDVVIPRPKKVDVPCVLDSLPPARVLAYPPESVVAEKFQILASLGMANSRMKDFYDLRTLARMFRFDGETLSESIKATFGTRDTPVPDAPPLALTPEFADDEAKNAQWDAFIKKLEIEHIPLPPVIEFLAGFLMPPAQAVARGDVFRAEWRPGGPWSNRVE